MAEKVKAEGKRWSSHLILFFLSILFCNGSAATWLGCWVLLHRNDMKTLFWKYTVGCCVINNVKREFVVQMTTHANKVSKFMGFALLNGLQAAAVLVWKCILKIRPENTYLVFALCDVTGVAAIPLLWHHHMAAVFTNHVKHMWNAVFFYVLEVNYVMLVSTKSFNVLSLYWISHFNTILRKWLIFDASYPIKVQRKPLHSLIYLHSSFAGMT